jgi:hypothetical protein
MNHAKKRLDEQDEARQPVACIKYIGLGLVLLVVLTACGGDSTSDPATNPTTSIALRLKVTVSEASVFSIPVRESQIVFRLIEGDQITPIAKTSPDLLGVVWYQVAQGETFGWIAGSQVQLIGAVDELPTVPDSVWAATSTPLDPTLVQLPSLTPTLGPPQGSIRQTEVTLYDQPSTASPGVGRLLAGDLVELLGQAGDFYLVGQNQRVLGWVQASALALEGDLASVPLVETSEVALSNVQSPMPPSATPVISPSPASATIPPTSTPRFTPSASPDLATLALGAPTATEIAPSPTPSPSATSDLVIAVGVPPPLTLSIPQDWQVAHLALPIDNAYIQGNLPFSIYRGPLPSGGTGTLWLIWGFPNITSPSGAINLYADGVQLLRTLVFDASTCNIGLGAEQRDYQVGDHPAIGTIFSAVECADSGDIAGFFAVTQVDGNNFAFFAGVEPVENVNPGSDDFQNILASVQFEEDSP